MGTMSEELQESIQIMFRHLKNTNKDVGIIKKESNGSSGVKKYNNRNEKFTIWNQQ